MVVDRQAKRVRDLLNAVAGSKPGPGHPQEDGSDLTVIDAATPAHVALVLSELSDSDILDRLLSDALHAAD